MNLIENTAINIKAINEVAKNYNTLDYSFRLSELLNTIYPTYNFNNTPKYQLHQLINKALVDNYTGEQLFKYSLFQQYFNKKNIVAAFEVKVNNSRTDFLCINGHTSCFEIKTSLDNLTKLSKQAADYLSAFEYNHLILDECHLQKAYQIVPESFGLLVYKNGRCSKKRDALLNQTMNPEVQLGLLTKTELVKYFPKQYGIKKTVLLDYTNNEINKQFKIILKERYKKRWGFIVRNQNDIFPIDIQFFFRNNILPEHVYFH